MKKRMTIMLLLITSLFSFNIIAYAVTIVPNKTVKNIDLPIKWDQYSDYEELQKAKQMDVFVPNDLPRGFVLQIVEIQHETIKGTYLNGKQSIIFIQSPALNDTIPKKDTWTTSKIETSLTWSTIDNNFEIKGNHVQVTDMNLFKSSLRSLSSTPDLITLPFEIIKSSKLSDTNAQRIRDFTLYTPTEFVDFTKKQKIDIEKKWKSTDDVMIIGLFAGQKGSSGYSINTLQVTLQNNQLSVMFNELVPTPDAIYLTVITYPSQFIAVRIPQGRTVSAVQFITSKGQSLANYEVK